MLSAVSEAEIDLCNAEPGPVEPRAWALELHPNGGFLSADGGLELGAGDGVAVSLKLSSGDRMSFLARVRWVRDEHRDQPGAWIDFTDLSGPERREFRRWIRGMRRERGSSRVAVDLRRKFRVRRAGSALAVWIGGRLAHGESSVLAEAVVEASNPTRSGALALCLDVRAFRPSPDDSLEEIRTWLEHVARELEPMGVMIGHGSIGTMQFGRLLREAGIADALVSFASVAEARPTWTRVCEQVADLEHEAGASGILRSLPI